MFHDECLPWLKKVTGLELTDKIDMTCSKYGYTGIYTTKPYTTIPLSFSSPLAIIIMYIATGGGGGGGG